MRAQHAREIRAGIDRARREFVRGIPPRPDVSAVIPSESVEERAYRRTVGRFRRPSRMRREPRLPPVPGIRRRRWGRR